MKTKLRRLAILALVLVLLTSNTIGVRASTTEYSALSYEELVVAIEQAEDMDTITISSVIVIPKGSTLGDSSKQVIIKYVGSAYIELELDNEFTATSTITNIIFDRELGTSLYPTLRARGKADFVNCTFKGASRGAVYSGYADLSFTGCTFSYNEGTYGGHFNAGFNTTAVFDRCSFSYGTSATKGGGIHIDNSTSYVTLKNCIITANESVYGGGIYNDGNLTLESTLLYNNHASTGGDDLCTSTTTYDLGTLETMEQEFKDQSIPIKPLSWETSTDGVYGYECYKLLYTTATTEEPTDPEGGDDTGGDTEDGGTTTPEDPNIGDNEDPTTPDGGDDTTDPSTPPDEGGDSSGEAPSDTEQGDNIDNSFTDNSVTDNSDHSTTDNSDHSSTDNSTTDNSITDNSQSSTDNSVTDNSTTDNSTVDNSITDNSTHTEDNSGSGNTTDNSTHSSTTDNSQHSSTVDNSSVVSNTDNSSSRSESSNTENSNNTTTYNYYQTEQDKGSTGAPQSISQPITVNVTVPQAKEPETGTQEPTEASQSIAQNIHIEAEGVNVKYEYTADGVSISISPYIAPESPTEAEAIPTAYSPVETPQEPAESPISWVDYVSMILLAILVLSELRDRWMRLKTKAE